MRLAFTAFGLVLCAGAEAPAYEYAAVAGAEARAHEGVAVGEADAPAHQATAVVAGRVVDATSGAAIPGTVVTLVSGAPAVPPAPGSPVRPTPPPAGATAPRRAVAVANSDGRFVFRELPPGPYTLTTTLGAYAPGAYGRRRPNGPSRALSVEAGARLNDVVISMWRLPVISGTLRDDRGEPLVGIGVWALRVVLSGGRQQMRFDGGTVEASDDRGQFRLTNLQPGSYLVCVRSAWQTVAMETSRAYESAVTAGTTAEMRRGWIETGGVWPQRDGLVSGDWKVSSSSAEIQPVPGPKGTIYVQPPSCAPGSSSPHTARTVTVAAGDDLEGVDVTLPLVNGVRVSGVLAGPTGPIANSGLRIYQAGAPGELTHEIPLGYSISDPSGRFAFLGIPPGSYVIRAYRVTPSMPLNVPIPQAAGAPGLMRGELLPPPSNPQPAMFADLAVTVGGSNVDGLSLTYEQGARIVGRIAFEGTTPAPDAARLQQIQIAMRTMDEPVSGLPGDTRVGADGRFTTPAYPAGRHMVETVAPPGPEWVLASIRIGGADAAGRAFTLSGRDVEDAVITFTDRKMSLSGAVRPAVTPGSPESTVVIFPADTQAWLASGMSGMRVATAATAPDGSYRLDVLLPGDYLVVAIPPEVDPVIDRDFIARFSPAAVKVSFAPGDVKNQALTVGRGK